MATEFWYNDNSVWRRIKELYYNDSGTWRDIKEAWYNDSGTWRKVFTKVLAGLNLNFPNQERYAVGVGTTTVAIQLVTDGTVRNAGGATVGTWYSPTTPGIGGSYYVRFDELAGPTLTLNTAAGLTRMLENVSAQNSVTLTSLGNVQRTTTVRLFVYADPGGATLLATKDFVLSANREL